MKPFKASVRRITSPCAGAPLFAALLTSALGCGTDRQVQGSLEAPLPRQARIALTPVLDVSEIDPAIADRLVVDQITIHLAETRLLGRDPRIPAGGLSLLSGGLDVSAFGGGSALQLPFPDYLLGDNDLGVYVRIDQGPEMAGASVIVRAHVFERPQGGGAAHLTAAPDPDGDPADPKGGRHNRAIGRASHALSSDADPAVPCAPDPDGDPATRPHCIDHAVHPLVQRGQSGPSVAIELRGDDAADLVASLNTSARLAISIVVPAARWFTPSAIEQIDRALVASQKTAEVGAGPDRRGQLVVVQSEHRAEAERGGEVRVENRGRPGAGDYSIIDDLGAGLLKIRR